MWSNPIVVLATVTLARPQSAVAVSPWLPACLTAKDNLGLQTRGDSNSLSSSVALLLSLSLPLCVRLCLSPSERIRWGVGWKQCISQASLVWIYSCPYVSPLFFSYPQIPLFPPYHLPSILSSIPPCYLFFFFIHSFFLLVSSSSLHCTPPPPLPSIPAPHLLICPSLSCLSCLFEELLLVSLKWFFQHLKGFTSKSWVSASAVEKKCHI